MARIPGSALRCPTDPLHTSFRGSQRVCHESSVELDAGGAIVGSTIGARIYELSTPRESDILCGICGARVWKPRPPIPFVPAEGMALLCNFATGFRPPEMVKMRPVVVLSARRRNRETCIVVPAGTSRPSTPKGLSTMLDPRKYPFLDQPSWTKCEMMTAVANRRLFLFRDRTGRGVLDSRLTMIDANDLADVRRLACLALGVRLTT